MLQANASSRYSWNTLSLASSPVLVSRRRNHAELLQKTQGIHFTPMLHDMTIGDTIHTDPAYRELLPIRWSAEKGRSRKTTADSPALNDLVSFCDKIFRCNVQVRERGDAAHVGHFA